MCMDMKKEIMSDLISLLILDEDEYHSRMLELTKFIAKKFGSICYVTLKRPSSELIRLMKESGVDSGKFTFVDGVAPSRDPGVIEVESPKGIAELMEAVNWAVSKKKFDVLLFDSLTMLELYVDRRKAVESVHSLMTKMRNSKTRTIFTILKKDIRKPISGTLGILVDRLVGKTGSVRLDHETICDDLDKLTEKLFGPETRMVVSGHRKDVTPGVYIKHWKEMMNAMLGPRNSEKQMASVFKKYLEEIQ